MGRIFEACLTHYRQTGQVPLALFAKQRGRKARVPSAGPTCGAGRGVKAAGLFHGKRDKYSSYGRCRECLFLDECNICPVSIGHDPSNTDPDRMPDFQCAYNLVSLKYRRRFPAQAGALTLPVMAGVPERLRRLFGFSRAKEAARP